MQGILQENESEESEVVEGWRAQKLHDALDKWKDQVQRVLDQEGDQGDAKELDVKVKLSVLEMLLQADIGDCLAWEE